jgi:hypothetical protein
MVMTLLGLILIASLSLCIVAVSLRLRPPARGTGLYKEPSRMRWVERAGLDVMVEE